MRFLATLLIAAVLAPWAGAQVIGIEFKDPRDKKRYRKLLQEKNGMELLIGEPLYGIKIDRLKGIMQIGKGVKRVGIVTADPAKPGRLLYTKTKHGTLLVKSRKRIAVLEQDVLKHGVKLHWVMRYETMKGLRDDYLRKKERLDRMEAELKKQKLSQPGWFDAFHAAMTEIDTLSAWLKGTLFPDAATRLQKVYKKRLERMQKVASKSRLEAAKNSVGPFEIPKRLDMKCKAWGHGGQWRGRESKHVRIIAHDGIAEAAIDELLVLAERIIEGFRSRFVDPLLKSGDEDPIKNEVFVEFFFAPDNTDLWNKIFTEFYGHTMPMGPEHFKQIPGISSRRGLDGADYLRFWRMGEGRDLEGIIANAMGQVLGNVAYNRNSGGEHPAWIIQGWGYWTSFEYLSRNTVTTFEWREGGYDRPAPKMGEKVVEKGLRATFAERALAEGPLMPDLFRMLLAEMSGPDQAKSWSVLDFLIAKHPDKLDRFLKDACASMNGSRMHLERFRPKAGPLFNVDAGTTDVYKLLDKLWKAAAEAAANE